MKKLGLFSLLYFILIALISMGLILFFGKSNIYEDYVLANVSISTQIFNYSIIALNYLGKFLGGYMLANIILFVVVWPGIILYLFILSWTFFKKTKTTYSKMKGHYLFTIFYILLVVGMMYPFISDPVCNVSLDYHKSREFFDICCNIIIYLSKISGISYEAMNISIFVILQPALIIYFLYSSIYFYQKYRLIKKTDL